jgi:hypothetical protein
MHEGVTLLDASMTLFDAVVEGDIGPMHYLLSQRFAYGTGIGAMPIGRHLLPERDQPPPEPA